jgi:hypothetical protein
MMTEAQSTQAPRHLWIVGVLALLWNLMGALDYVMTELRVEAYMGKYSPEQLEFFYGFPTWVVALWAVAVWGGVLATVLLLMRRKLAYPLFLVSFVCMVVTTIQNYASGAADVTGAMGMFFSVVIFVIALALVFYTRRMVSSGVLT